MVSNASNASRTTLLRQNTDKENQFLFSKYRVLSSNQISTTAVIVTVNVALIPTIIVTENFVVDFAAEGAVIVTVNVPVIPTVLVTLFVGVNVVDFAVISTMIVTVNVVVDFAVEVL